MSYKLNKIIEELADISYTTLDIKEDIIRNRIFTCDTLKKITKVHKVLSNTQNKLIQLNK